MGSFSDPVGTPRPEAYRPHPSHRSVVVRITHASVGVTDALAHRGQYLLQPRPGFVPGYDFVGTIEHAPPGTHDFDPGQRVAGVLPRMGAHATRIAVRPSLLVAVPDRLESAIAATIPLDGVTARLALDALGDPGTSRGIAPPRAREASTSRSVLVHGAGGSLGAWATQLARRGGWTVYGTTSARSRAIAEIYGARVFHYTHPAWMEDVVAATGGLQGIIDHTGDRTLARLMRPGGTVVRTAFGSAPAGQRGTTARGFALASLRRYTRPAERVISTPIAVALHRTTYRRHLRGLLDLVASGDLIAPTPVVVAFADYPAALAAAVRAAPGTKIVLAVAD